MKELTLEVLMALLVVTGGFLFILSWVLCVLALEPIRYCWRKFK